VVFAFLLVNFESFLFWYFEVLKSSIFLLVILGFFNLFVKFHKGGDGVFVFLLKTLKVFCFGILKF
jgi:hypothetical protein